MKYKCLIVDDEAPAHKVLHSHIKKSEVLEIVGDCFDGKEALDFLTKNKVDVVFLDIEMPRLTGLELLQCIPYPTIVILTTAYSNFGFEAYQSDVVDYMLKPISYPRFLKALNKVQSLLGPKIIETKEPVEIELKLEGIMKQIKIDDILYIEAVGNYIKIHFKQDKSILVTQTMKYISSLLPSSSFTRIHKSFIVQRAEIAEIKKTVLTLSNSVSLPIGRKFSVLLEQ
jgi:two-component system, LytTR family, response regulator